MRFADYTDCTIGLAVDLVNARGDDHALASVASLTAFLRAHSFSGVGRVTAADLRAIRALHPTLAAVFAAADARAAADVVNTLIADVGALPRLSDHDDEPLHLHYEAPGASLADRVTVEIAMGLAGVLATDGLARFKTCARPGCDDVFIDVSRNRSRRFCDATTCGNAVHVAAHRRRQRDAPLTMPTSRRR